MTNQKIMTKAQFISHVRHGGKVVFEAEDGLHTVTKAIAPGYYAVDDKEIPHTLQGITTWFGAYHTQYGEAVFFPVEVL